MSYAMMTAARISGGDRSFTASKLFHVGQHYDLAEFGRSFQILVVAMETGGSGRAQGSSRSGWLDGHSRLRS